MGLINYEIKQFLARTKKRLDTLRSISDVIRILCTFSGRQIYQKLENVLSLTTKNIKVKSINEERDSLNCKCITVHSKFKTNMQHHAKRVKFIYLCVS